SGLRLRIPAPLQFTGFRIARFEEPGIVHRIATDANQHVVADNNGSRARIIFELQVSDFLVPALSPVLNVQRNQMIIRSLKEQPVAVDANSPVSNVYAAG